MLKIKTSTDETLLAHQKLCEEQKQYYKDKYDRYANNSCNKFLTEHSTALTIGQVSSAWIVSWCRGYNDPIAQIYWGVTFLWQMAIAVPYFFFGAKQGACIVKECGYTLAAEYDRTILANRKYGRQVLSEYAEAKTPVMKRYYANRIREVVKLHHSLSRDAVAVEKKYLPKKHQSFLVARYAGRQRG